MFTLHFNLVAELIRATLFNMIWGVLFNVLCQFICQRQIKIRFNSNSLSTPSAKKPNNCYSNTSHCKCLFKPPLTGLSFTPFFVIILQFIKTIFKFPLPTTMQSLCQHTHCSPK
mmetsp:Transcript_59878/g.135057  ORF Transcript_59878/g.135057 Transcript_59878/m.135057 type:complete len:114 (-) Transcript_59878:516-857(-)